MKIVNGKLNSNCVLVAVLVCGLCQMAWAQGPRFDPDPRVEARTYTFEETGEEMPWWVFVSSKADLSAPVPLVVMLHGLGVPGGFMM